MARSSESPTRKWLVYFGNRQVHERLEIHATNVVRFTSNAVKADGMLIILPFELEPRGIELHTKSNAKTTRIVRTPRAAV